MKSKITKPLLLITIILWGFIIYSISQVVFYQEENSTAKISNLQLKEYKGEKYFHYKRLSVDPFRHKPNLEVQLKTKKSNPVENKDIKVLNEQIPFICIGVIIGEKRNSIIKNSETGETIIVKEGSLVKNYIVHKILKNRIEVLDKNNKQIKVLEVN